MTGLFKVILFLLTFSSVTMAQTGKSNTGMEELFDFWIGEWQVSWDEGSGNTGRGTNSVEKILDGSVIKENFSILEGKSKGFKGTSISVLRKRDQVWKQAWADNQGSYFDFTGRAEGEKRIFETDVRKLEDGREFVQRMIFYNISENSLTWDWESSDDGGTTWKLNWRILYKRIR